MSRRNRIIAITLSFLCSILAVQVAYAQNRPCADLEVRRSLDEGDRLRTWDALYNSYKTFGRCDDGALGEGYSESVARILADHWNTLPRFVQLAAQNVAFRAFVIRHLDATLNMDDVVKIKHDAQTHCPSGLRKTCNDMVKQANATLEDYVSP